MRDIKVSCGIWFLGATSDRFVRAGYRPDKTIRERFELAASIEGVQGLEMHYPTEVTDDTYKDLKQLADDLGMEIVQFCPRVGRSQYKFSRFTNPDPAIRQSALDLAKRTTDIAQYMEAHIMVTGLPGQLSTPSNRPPPRARCGGNLAAWCGQPRAEDRRRIQGLGAALASAANHRPRDDHRQRDQPPEPRRQHRRGARLHDEENLAGHLQPAATASCSTHWNDNWKLFDDDVIVGTVNLWETLRRILAGRVGLRQLVRAGHTYREDPATPCAGIRNLQFGYGL